MKKYNIKSTKSESIQKLISQALEILESVGIPFEKKSPRALECLAMQKGKKITGI
jgi:hypothetical protein